MAPVLIRFACWRGYIAHCWSGLRRFGMKQQVTGMRAAEFLHEAKGSPNCVRYAIGLWNETGCKRLRWRTPYALIGDHLLSMLFLHNFENEEAAEYQRICGWKNSANKDKNIIKTCSYSESLILLLLK